MLRHVSRCVCTRRPCLQTWLSAQLGVDTSTEEAEAVYDALHAFVHQGPFFIVDAIGFTAHALVSCARMHGLDLNFWPGRTEAILSLRGPGAHALRVEIDTLKGILAGDLLIRVVSAYKHLGTSVTSTACPTQDAARRVSLASGAYSKVSGHFLSSMQFNFKI